MKNILIVLFLVFTIASFSQKIKDPHAPYLIKTSQLVKRVTAIAGRNLVPPNTSPVKNNNNRWLNYPTNFNTLPTGVDPLLNQNNTSLLRTPGNPVMENFDGAIEGTHTGAGVPDSTGAVGPNHYVHSYNSGFVIFDKQGNILVPHASLESIFPGESDGDPIILYDRYADRFIITQFKVGPGAGGPFAFLMAICQGSDPVNDGWNTYQFDVDDMPDYPKFSIWHDGYYITANKSNGHNTYVINRDEMIAGNTTAQMAGFNLPGVTENPNVVFAPLAMNSIGPNLPDTSTPAYITYLQDDAWADGPDHLKIWEIDMNWVTVANSTISDPTQINTTPFDSFTADFGTGEVPQPGTSQKIDGITGVVSFACNYYAFEDHNSVTLNFNVDVNGDNTKLGIRWFELRDTDNNWSIEQEGTFAPDDDLYRYMGSMAMDSQGNIGLAYSRGNANTFTSLYFTGRHANDTPGQMTVDEEVIIDGLGVNMLHNRFGDYSHLTLDPFDNKTFWFVGEYFDASNNWRTRIASFKIAPNTVNDVGIVAITNPEDGTLTNSEQVTVTMYNFGENPQSNIPISYSLDGTVIANEIYTGTINSTSSVAYTFSANTDLSTVGQTYVISATTNLAEDEDTSNDTYSKNVKHLEPNDIGVTALIAPVSGNTLTTTEQITMEISNFGGEEQINFDVSYSINSGTIITETVTTALPVSGTLNYTFNQTGDFFAFNDYVITIFTSLTDDSDVNNNSLTSTITKANCEPSADCTEGDGLRLFQLGAIDNTSSCEGYADFTHLSTILALESTNSLTVTTQYGDQHLKVWIDFDDDFVFELDELVVADYVIAVGSDEGTFTETMDLVIPNITNLGSHLMRAKTNWDEVVPDDACEDTEFGETEDYTVVIAALAGIDDVLHSLDMVIATLDNNVFKITMQSPNYSDTMIITMHNTLGQQFVKNRVDNRNGNYAHTLNLNGLASGVYLVRLGNKDFGKVKRIIVK